MTITATVEKIKSAEQMGDYKRTVKTYSAFDSKGREIRVTVPE